MQFLKINLFIVLHRALEIFHYKLPIMKVICATSYLEIKEIIDHYNIKNENQTLFRGTSSLLVPSIIEKCSFNTYADIVAKEYLLLNDFINYSNVSYDLDNIVAKDWEIRISAREHGLASSLMDWTNSLDIALEFAINDFERKKLNYTSLWVLKKSTIHQVTISSRMDKKESFKELVGSSIIQFPKYNETDYARRKFIQGGYFLFQSPLNLVNPVNLNNELSEHLMHIIIPKSIVPNIWKHIVEKVNLSIDVCANFNDSSRALDEVCKDLNKKYA